MSRHDEIKNAYRSLGGEGKMSGRKGLKNVCFRQGDVGKLPFPDGSFDLVLTLNGFHAFPDKKAAYSLRKRLKAMYRKAEVKTVEGMAAFRCRKGKADAQG